MDSRGRPSTECFLEFRSFRGKEEACFWLVGEKRKEVIAATTATKRDGWRRERKTNKWPLLSFKFRRLRLSCPLKRSSEIGIGQELQRLWSSAWHQIIVLMTMHLGWLPRPPKICGPRSMVNLAKVDYLNSVDNRAVVYLDGELVFKLCCKMSLPHILSTLTLFPPLLIVLYTLANFLEFYFKRVALTFCLKVTKT